MRAVFLFFVGVVTFPIDFFEHCQAMNEVEFGGNDLLQIYNTQQIRHRLNTTGINALIQQ
jgi:E3 ubiquitin-protein ligase UBR4